MAACSFTFNLSFSEWTHEQQNDSGRNSISFPLMPFIFDPPDASSTGTILQQQRQEVPRARLRWLSSMLRRCREVTGSSTQVTLDPHFYHSLGLLNIFMGLALIAVYFSHD